jgi:hypothetical protein
MAEQSINKQAFTEVYRCIVEAYATHLLPGAKQNPAPALVPEQFEACWAAECHRQFWKPEKARLVLIAESHVYTDTDDLKARIRADFLPAAAVAAPPQFVRLIYCLGYGDNSLLTHRPVQSNERDTDFWNLFSRAANMDLRQTYPVAEKVEILQRLQKRGIWLADASIHACMNPRYPWSKSQRDKRRNIECFPRLYRSVINASWKYVSTTIPTQAVTWIIGKCVRDAIEDPSLDNTRWFYQPGAGLPKSAQAVQEEQLKKFWQELNALT